MWYLICFFTPFQVASKYEESFELVAMRDMLYGKEGFALHQSSALLACLHDQNKSGFFEGPAFIQLMRAICKVFKKLWLAGKKPALQKSHFCFDRVNRPYVIAKLVLSII